MEKCSTQERLKKLDKIQLSVSGVEYTVNTADVAPEMTLNTYLRDVMNLTGTKRMCLEGGCGSCIVAVEKIVNGLKIVFAVNSCLVSVLSCHGWKIHTVEGIGGPLKGFHEIQTALAHGNGTQCGFCSPGQVMNMYALMEGSEKQLTESTVENSFGGVLCRCTGYRPIVQSFRSLVKKAKDGIKDIEDVSLCTSEDKCKTNCEQKCKKINYYHTFKASKWMKVHTLTDLLDILISAENASYMLVGGNTAKGVYYIKNPPQLYIDITDVKELTTTYVDSNSVILGANTALTKSVEIFENTANEYKEFQYLNDMAHHIKQVASVPVRNIGTLAGNLMIKHAHNEFPSDIFLIMETFKATLSIVDTTEEEVLCTPQDFLRLDMSKKVIKQIILKPLTDSYKWITYKIMPRAQNAHAEVNAGFLFSLSPKYVVQSARIVYGGISPQFVHASKTEELLKGKVLFDNKVLAQAFGSLDKEIQPTWELPESTPTYRKGLAIALFYKFILNKCPKELLSNSRFSSGGTMLERPLSTATQEFGTNTKNYPLSEPVPKVEALAQTSGQAEYCADLPDLPNQAFGAFVTAAAVANSQIGQIDPTEALNMQGVLAFYSAKDVPGNNTFMPKMGGFPVQDELFCNGRVQYYYQPIGLIVADSHDTAVKAAEMVKVEYTAPTEKPFLNVKQVVDAGAKDRIKNNTNFIPKSKGNDIKKVIKGEFYTAWQYHFHMEVQCCQVVPTEDGFDIYPVTQWMDLCQLAAAEALAIPTQTINVKVRRLGGSFGGKISRNSLISTAAAVAAFKLRRPVKIWLPFITNMNVIGKRYPQLTRYEVGVDAKGVMQYLKADIYSDFGVGGNDIIDPMVVDSFQNVYVTDTWRFSTYQVSTDTHANTWTRAPGTLEAMGSIETIFEHIAYEMNLDPVQVRQLNTDSTKHGKILGYWKEIETWADIPARRQSIEQFNKQNRWKKRGMSLIPMAWMLEFKGSFTVLVSIVHGDGGIMVCHGGVEMGQGINTKVVQVVAFKFGVTMNKVQVKPSLNLVAPNAFATGGSVTSEAVVYAIIQACDKLIASMKPVMDRMKNPTWEQLVRQCFVENIQLSADGYIQEKSPGVQGYPIYGLCATEVEVDILTGQKLIRRVDIIEDVGDSMSPLIDIGQTEGAFVMGIGFYTIEQCVFDSDGRLTTNRTWNYKVPGMMDIPVDYRIKFPQNNPNPVGILKAKAIGEPPMCLSISVPLAIRRALAAAREEADPTQPKWVPVDGTTSTDFTFRHSLNNFNQYVI